MTVDRPITIVLLSFWRNDTERRLRDRVRHLWNKAAPPGTILGWLWYVCDSTDETAVALAATLVAEEEPATLRPVVIVNAATGIVGEDTPARRRRMAETATQAFTYLGPMTDMVLLHESDLVTPVDIVGRLLGHWGSGGVPEAHAGWPTLGEGGPFYDTYAYRHLNGRHFDPTERADRRFEVASFGSCWLAPAALVHGRTLGVDCVVDLCRQWKAEGVHLWVDPAVPVVQPVDLWSPQAFE